MWTLGDVLELLVVFGGGYLLGSIPFGVVVMRLAGAGDPRAIGSGNIGATNVLRSGRKGLALATLLGDGLKGAAAVLIGRMIGHETLTAYAGTVGAVAGVGAFLGHLFPIWLGFRGGKGVATFFGVILAAAWPVGAACAVVWLAVAALLRFSSLAALTAAAVAPGLCLLVRAPVVLMWMSLALAVLVFVRHAANIARLRAGTEPRIGAKAPAPADPAA
jgi:acyl phosphate:glycerol-3-phosphate acyltransferase